MGAGLFRVSQFREAQRALSALAGALAGYEIRRRLVKKLHVRDFLVALCEAAVAISLAWLLVSR